jgi:hypothetical protein
MGADVSTEMTFVRRFIGRKPYVAIETVTAIFRSKTGDAVVEHRNSGNGLPHTVLEILAANFIFIFMSLKPRTVVVGGYFFQESMYSFYIHLFL